MSSPIQYLSDILQVTPVNNGAITSYHHMVALALTETLKNIKHNIKPGVQTV